MSAGESRLSPAGAKARPLSLSTRFVALSHLRRLRGCEQVAAVCYRTRGTAIEFLLVQTRGGRWTFPKGSAEPGLTHAQAAALEAFEEAGVHGRMEEVSFTRYTRRKRGPREASSVNLAVNAHLCEVLWLGPPQESDRNPTWYSPEKAKRRLRDDRTSGDGAELARVVDRAIARIHRLRRLITANDALQKVHFAIDHSPGVRSRNVKPLKRRRA